MSLERWEAFPGNNSQEKDCVFDFRNMFLDLKENAQRRKTPDMKCQGGKRNSEKCLTRIRPHCERIPIHDLEIDREHKQQFHEHSS